MSASIHSELKNCANGNGLPTSYVAARKAKTWLTEGTTEFDKGSDDVLSQHRTSLARLKEGYEQAEKLHSESSAIALELTGIAAGWLLLQNSKGRKIPFCLARHA